MSGDKVIDGCLWPAGCSKPIDDIQEVGVQFIYINANGDGMLFTVEKVSQGSLTLRGADGLEYYCDASSLNDDQITIKEKEDEEG